MNEPILPVVNTAAGGNKKQRKNRMAIVFICKYSNGKIEMLTLFGVPQSLNVTGNKKISREAVLVDPDSFYCNICIIKHSIQI